MKHEGPGVVVVVTVEVVTVVVVQKPHVMAQFAAMYTV